MERRQELAQEEGIGGSGSDSSPPIATTPPPSHVGRKEELLSQSSSSPGSGTQVSSTSRVSLGEAIRQTANQGMESWYQLSAEEDASCFVLGAEQTELPTMEEGILSRAAEPEQRPAGALTHSPLLEIQDSGLSPRLPLLISNTTQGKRFFEDTLFQQSELEFAPLRGSLDVSELFEQHARSLQISDAVQLAATEVSTDLVSGGFTLSQHPLDLSTLQAGDASSICFLSQHPISPFSLRAEEGKEHGNQTDDRTLHCNPGGDKNFVVPDTLMRISSQIGLQKHGISPADQANRIFPTGDVSFLNTSIPAPLLLDLLEKEVGLSSSAGVSSRSGNSSSTSSSRDSEKEKTQQQVEDTDMQELESLGQEFCQSLSDGKSLLEFDLLLRDSTEANFATKSSKMSLTSVAEGVDLNNFPQSDLSGITIHPGNRQFSSSSKDELVKHVGSEILHRHQEKEASDSTRNSVSQRISFQPATVSADSTEQYIKKKSAIEVQPGDIRAELTASSGCSIERGHKYTDISSSVNPPMDDSTFCVRLVGPISQSTPGIFMNKSTKEEVLGKLSTIKSSIQASHLSLSEEHSSRSSESTLAPAFQRMQSDQSGHEANFESSESLRGSSPTGRIGSLPTLSYIEKIGAWNMNRSSEKISFDTLALHGLTGLSPKKKAYSAVADSLNRMLSKHISYSNPKKVLAATFVGASSLTGLHSEDQRPMCTLPLTRSQSDNIVNVVSKDNLQAEDLQAKILKETAQALKEDDINKSSNTGMLDGKEKHANLTKSREKHIKASLDTKGSMHDYDFKGSNKSLEENMSNSNEKVPKLVKENACDRLEKFSIPKQPPDAICSTSKISLDQFSDVSIDADVNMLYNSQSNSHVEQIVIGSTGVVSDHSLTSLEIDNYVPYWSPTIKTPDKKELNIEERIPTYLHNLGIDQSPSTILTPFVPRGTIKELEFSPSEHRTLKGSRDTLTKSVSQFEGDSQKEDDNSQSSPYSGMSTLSMSIPMGSDVGNDTPLPSELSSPLLLRSSQERPISQCNITYCHTKQQVELEPHFPIESIAEIAITEESTDHNQMLPELSISNSSNEKPQIVSKRVQMLIDKFESRSPILSQDHPASSSLVESAVEMEGNKTQSSCLSVSFNQQNKDLENDSFVGSRTLKEIRKLLEEAEDITFGNSHPAFPFGSMKEYNECFLLSRNLNDFCDSTSSRDSTENLFPLLHRSLSWSPSSNLSKDNSQMKTLSSLMDSLKWETTDGIERLTIGEGFLQEPIGKKTLPLAKETVEQSKLAKPLSRSEPEGCSSAIADTKAPNSTHPEEDGTTEESSVEKGFDLQSSLTTEILSGISNSLEGLEHAVAQMNIMGNVKGDSIRESDDSSSADSLAARVTSLLKGEDPLTRATQMIQNAEEEEKRARVWVKLKLVSQPPGSGVDLSEEDRKKIEEIKAELLQSAKKAGSAKSLLSLGSNSKGLKQWQDMEQFKTLNASESSDHSLMYNAKPDGVQNKNTRDFTSIDLIHTNPSHIIDNLLPCDSTYAFASKELPVLHQIQQFIAFPVDNISTELHKDSSKNTDTSLKGMAGITKIQIEQETLPSQHLSDVSKPIASITFSSRKRSPSPSVSPVLNTDTAEDNPQLHSIVPMEDQTIVIEDQSHLIRQLGTSRVCALLDSKSHLLTGDRDKQLQENQDSKAGTFQRKDVRSGQGPKSDVMEQSQSFSAQRESFQTAQTLRPDFPQEITSREVKTQFEASSVNSTSIGTGNNSVVQPSSLAHLATIDSVLSSSPTRKALSCVRVTLSPKPDHTKLINLEFDEKPNEYYIEAGARPSRNSETDRQGKFSISPLRSLTVSKLTDSESAPKSQGSSYFPVPVSYPESFNVHYSALSRFDTAKDLSPLPLVTLDMPLSRKMPTMPCDSSRQIQWQDDSKSVVPAQREKASSDAMTQITTESPEKTTFSAEIYISPSDDENITNRSLNQKVGASGVSPLPPNRISLSSQLGDQSQLLSHRRARSPEVFFPYPEGRRKISPVRSDTTIESSHPGSNDAVAPYFPVEVLGSRDSDVSEIITIKHEEGIYSRRVEPKRAWEEFEKTSQETLADSRKHLELTKMVQPVSRLGQKPTSQDIHHLQQQDSAIPSAYIRNQGTLSSSRDLFRHESSIKEDHLQFLGYPEKEQQGEEDRFSPLRAEVDYSKDDFISDMTSQYETLNKESKLSTREQTRGYSLTNSQETDDRGRRWRIEPPLKQSTLSNGSLDELWAKFTERQKKHQSHYNNNSELSLVQRLDRLARLLQNPVIHSLMAVDGKQSSAMPVSQKQKEMESRHKVGQESGSSRLGFHQHASDVAAHSKIWHSEDTPDFAISKQSRPHQIEEISTERIRRILQQTRYLDIPSESSSTAGPAKEEPSTITDTTESEVATQTDSEMVAQTETGSSISTIDTARLIRAFGLRKVHVPPKLSQLYSTIDQQKNRFGNQGKGSRKTTEKDHKRMPFSEMQRSRKDTQIADSVISSDTTSIASSSWGPSPALSNKRNARLLNKGVQAGDLEIVNSATKRNTRDVGMTFPSPASKQEMVPKDSPDSEHTWKVFSQPDWRQVQVAGTEAEEKKWPDGILMERTTRKNKLNLARGVSWFVPAEDLKSDSRKENNYKPASGPGPAWFESLTHTKPWRKPLQEKYMQEKLICNQISTQTQPAISPEEVVTKISSPFVRITMQEALKMCRPDFISKSRQRVRRLELLAEERQLQNVFENHMVLQNNAIPKKEMVQRSKRMYEQLPEIKKRKEEEKRKEEYKSYRLKAQLYRKKVMNNILGRKTPWN
ncbi:Alstrom syndrome protein 1 isoform X2 [Rhinatrema bivittatum]|uniref:Alstrom syndrome protein 1 isoform X2 n=1 Tax=Rhinatrema bivittatum TaxID=194408 RepID=UPI0011265034|nr:Alstrom syndrome protein 1 isoform X2 [Rhinatrema bivittatum]